MARTRRLKLKIVLETNIIFNGGTYFLSNKATNDLIEKYKDTNDIILSWHLPEIVVFERTFQMVSESLALLPAVNKVEKNFGLDLKIDRNFIEQRVAKLIAEQIKNKKLDIIPLEDAKVNWKDLIQKACFRKPPFEIGETEKGFKDALILESLIQLVNNSPKSRSSCRIIFVSNDTLLVEAFKERTSQNSNVDVLTSLSALENFINILLTTEIKQRLIKSIADEVKRMFFTKDDRTTVYYNSKVSELIVKQFSSQLNDLPVGGEKRFIRKWIITDPVFIKKVGNEVYWKSEIVVDSDVLKSSIVLQSLVSPEPIQPKTYAISTGLGITPSNLTMGGLLGLGSKTLTGTTSGFLDTPTFRKDVVIQKGKSKFDVYWITTVTATKKVKFLKLESIKYLETTWEAV
jgi:hypothetical protein